MRRHPHPFWIYTALVVLIFAVYGQVAHFDFTNYDDPEYVIENPHITNGLTAESLTWAVTTGYASNWLPLTWISYMLEYRLFGLNSGLQHLVNVLLHVLSSILLFAVLRRMTGTFWRAALVAGLFALHPLRVESVAWIAERKDTLSAFFWILTMWCYVRYAHRPSVPRYLSTIGSFTLGLMAKPMLVTLPFALLLLDVWPLNRLNGQSLWKRIGEKLPMLGLSVAVSAIEYLVQQPSRTLVSIGTLPLSFRLENALVSYAVYLRMMIWPAGLAPFYPIPAIPVWQPVMAGIVVGAISLFVFLKGGEYPYLTVGWLWYLGTLVPVLGLVLVGSQARADRYTYIPMIGILIVVVWGLSDLARTRQRTAIALRFAYVVALVAFSGLTAIQVSYWRDSITLFRHTIAVTKKNYVAYNNLGAVMLSKEEPAEAVPYLSQALEYDPQYAEAHTNLGMALDDLGRSKEALNHFAQAIHIDPENAEAQADIGVLLAKEGAGGDEALAHVRDALRIRPNFAGFYFNLGEVYGILERPDEAEQAFQESIQLDPSDPRAYLNLGIALGVQGKLPEATTALRTATRLKPNYPTAWFNLGSALAQADDLDEAIAAFTEAVRLKPDFTEARDALAGAQTILHRHN